MACQSCAERRKKISYWMGMAWIKTRHFLFHRWKNIGVCKKCGRKFVD